MHIAYIHLVQGVSFFKFFFVTFDISSKNVICNFQLVGPSQWQLHPAHAPAKHTLHGTYVFHQ